jgi:hypothetical protein
MEILTEVQHRALAFIGACVRSGYKPTREEVGLWLDKPLPMGGSGTLALTGFRSIMAQLASALGSSTVTGEDQLQHLSMLGWVTESQGRISIAPLGRALLTSAEAVESAETEGVVIMLDTDDQFAYAKLIGHLNQAGEGLLVDAYFRLPQLMTILTGTGISRILMSKQHKSSRADRAELTIALTSPALPRTIEVRASSDDALHDRLIVGDDGKVWILGTSLNSVGQVHTALIPLSFNNSVPFRERAERLWDAAEPLLAADDTAVTAPDQADTASSS